MSELDIMRFIDSTEVLTLKEKAIIKSTYPAVKRGFGIASRKEEVEFLSNYIAFVRLSVSVA